VLYVTASQPASQPHLNWCQIIGIWAKSHLA
jgi:hypothetical protein